ncbi:NUDIX domain-containing protein [Jeongeupia sp. HS-3]|uniref:NUDIX hydrolase n=1 Tax=Jeongeupia sp. HS-3 TaxID=1009682 RepID=UPI001F20E568|nr:NUDIX domain-containing protein [Jeongeupia sp. HS-3]
MTLALVREGRLLTVRKRGTQHFMLPGGKPEAGEADSDGLIREIAEELSCALESASLVLLGEFAASAANEPGRDVLARVHLGELSGDISLAAEIEALHWLDLDKTSPVLLAPLLVTQVLPALRRMTAPAS